MCFRGLDGLEIVDATANEEIGVRLIGDCLALAGYGYLMWNAELMCAVRPTDNKVCNESRADI